MPQVPTYNPGQVQQRAAPSVGVSTNVNSEAFGAGQSRDNVNQAAQGLASNIGQIILKEKEKADKTFAQEGDNSLSQFKVTMLTDPEHGFQTLKGKAAPAALGGYLESFDKKSADLLNSAKNERQKELLKPQIAAHRLEYENNLNRHAGVEIEKYDAQVTKTGVESTQNEANLFWQNPGKIEESLNKQAEILKTYGSKYGMDEATIKLQIDQAKAKTLSGVIDQQLLSGNTDQAKKLFADNREAFGDNAINIEKNLKNHETLDKSVAAWKDLRNYKLADGIPDEARMKTSIMARTDLAQDEKEKMWDYVKAQASEAKVFKAQRDNANERTFLNTASQLRQDGTPLDTSMRLLDKYAIDDYDRSVKATQLRKLYAPNEASDPKVFLSLWEKVQDGEGTKESIDEALNKNSINVADHRSLREQLYNGQAQGKDPKVKLAWDRVNILAGEKYGDREERTKFIYDMHQSVTKGMSPEAIFQLANDKIKNDPSTGKWSFTQDEQWKTDFQKRDSTSLAWAKAYSDVGKQETAAIGAGIMRNGKKSFEPSDLENFAQELGGYQNIKAGTPAHNAIQLLIEMKQPVTAANVKAMLGRVGSK